MEGTGIRPSTRPDPVPERARADRSETPQRGHTLALRSISPRQLGHIRCAVSKETSSFDPKAERRDFFSRCSLNQILGGNSILRRTAWRRTNRATKTSKAPEGRGLFCNGKPRAYHPAAHGQLISGSRLRLACSFGPACKRPQNPTKPKEESFTLACNLSTTERLLGAACGPSTCQLSFA